jgi:uncharacterized protein YyaL (SSP411 family)
MNRLGNETSLYLRQHADNPVNWQPWDETALAEARERDCPILLSIGYSACHWCHVMAHESFDDEQTAEEMNHNFVNIKVDREERPDLDRIYQMAHQMLTGRGGGWPLTVFLDPADQTPFFAGTYFPPARRYGMPSFQQVLQALHRWYSENRNEVREQNEKLNAALESIRGISREPSGPESTGPEDILHLAVRQICSRLDPVNGGFSGAPKFPQAPLLEAMAALLPYEDGNALESGLKFTLQKMAVSGLRDHLDGGFFRYCVDDTWTIPHFEKMLYDNAMLLPLYAEGAARWNDPLLESAAEGIADWLQTAMIQPTGGFAASIDADAAGEEGGFHVWTPEQVEAVLSGKSLEIFKRAFGLDQPPNFEGRAWHLLRFVPDSQLAVEFEEPEESIAAMLDAAREKLVAEREKRVHPTLDDKQLTSWNALLAAGLVRAGRSLGSDEWLDRAADIFDFIRKELWLEEGLLAVFNQGSSRFEAYLDDYAWLLNALLDYLQARWDDDLLNFALQLTDALLSRFEDPEHGGFFFSDAAVKVPLGRSMLFQDDATPAGNAGAIIGLNRIGRLVGEVSYTEAANRCLERAMPQLQQSPMGHGSLLTALIDTTQPPPHLVIGGRDSAKKHQLKKWVDRHYRLDCYLIPPSDGDLPGILGDYRSDDSVTAWLCEGLQCLPPVSTQDELEQQLKSMSKP